MKNKKLSRIIRHLVFLSPFIFPAYFLRFSIAGIPFTALELVVYLLFALWFISILLKQNKLQWDRLTSWYWYAAFGILLGTAMGVLIAPTFIDLPSGETLNARITALGIWKGWVTAPVLYFAVLTQTLKSKEDVEKILRFFFYSSAAVALIAHGFGLFSDGVTIDLRLRGFYESANYLALYLVPAILIGIYFFAIRKAPLRKIDHLDVAALVIVAYALFFTQSYAGILGVFGALGLTILYLIFKIPKLRKKMGASVIALILIFLGVTFSQMSTSKFQQFLDWENRSSTSVRIEIYKTSIDLIKENPIFGHGPGLFQANYQNQAPETLGHAPLEWNMPHPHNIFLGFWLNAGLVGLVAFLILIVLIHIRFTYPLIAMWGLLIHGLFDMPFWKNDLAMIFWLVMACILILQKHELNPAQEQTVKSRRRPIRSTHPRAKKRKAKA